MSLQLVLSSLGVAFANKYTLDDSQGLGMKWEGVGAISGGGATTKLLMDYPPKQASEVLDYLFTPDVGLNLQMLKVELGGDTDATEGAEPSHIHFPGDAPNYKRGYEWWLMKEARKRNPDIKLYALPWGWPGWLDSKSSSSQTGKNAFQDANKTAQYTVSWLEGAKNIHGLDIDYIGQWNERDAPPEYVKALKEAVEGNALFAGNTKVIDRLDHYPGSGVTADPQGCQQHKQEQDSAHPRWVDEEGSTFDGRLARCLARVVNRMYVSGCYTATFQWHLISSFYDYLPWARCGVAVANTPWSGSYEITSPTWALAHTSQFNPVGWRYTQHNKGVQMLQSGGSMVTRISPDGNDFSVVIEKMNSKTSVCARGPNPSHAASPETVALELRGSFLRAARKAGALQVWRSNLSSSDEYGSNPPDSQLFQQVEALRVNARGVVRLQVMPDSIVTITTLQTKGKRGPAAGPTPPEKKSFPVPFSQHFDTELISAPAKYWYDQMGAWEIQDSPYGDKAQRGKVMRQVVPVWPICWGYSCTGPTTYFGPAEFLGDITVSFDVRLEDTAALHIIPQGKTAGFELGALRLDTNGTYKLGDHEGSVDFSTNKWHRVSLRTTEKQQTVYVDGHLLLTADMKPSSLECKQEPLIEDLSETEHAMLSAGGDAQDLCGRGRPDQGWNLKVQLSRYIYASIDNFHINKDGLPAYLQMGRPTQFDPRAQSEGEHAEGADLLFVHPRENSSGDKSFVQRIADDEAKWGHLKAVNQHV